MKTLKMVSLAFALVLSSANIANSAPADPQVMLYTTPANPIIGELVTCIAKVTAVVNVPNEYDWSVENGPTGTDLSEVNGPSVKVVFDTAGEKSFTLTVKTGNQWVKRKLTLDVFEGRISIVYPYPYGTVWKIGGTYTIQWKTEGNVPHVQIGFYDPKTLGPDEIPQMVTYLTQNTGSFTYTVPDTVPLGTNYHMYVSGFVPTVSGYSLRPFSIVASTATR